VDAAERQRLVDRHLHVAERCAKILHKRVANHIELEELIAMANAGLAEAVASYDPARGTAFSTWAWYRIQGSMIDGLRRASSLPRRVWANLTALRAANDYLENLGERDTGAAQRGIKPKEKQQALAAVKDALSAIRTMYMTSLDRLKDDEGFDKPEEPGAPAVERIHADRLARRLRKALAALPDKERELVTKHYYEGKNLLEAGAELGISKSWASRLHAQAINKLRAACEPDY
jgi:RNA polymerase sigma factor for flagellar operon FliA